MCNWLASLHLIEVVRWAPLSDTTNSIELIVAFRSDMISVSTSLSGCAQGTNQMYYTKFILPVLVVKDGLTP